MIGFLDLQFVTRRRRLAELRRARRIFAWSATLSVGASIAAYWLAAAGHPWLASAAIVLALWAFALNCAAISKLRDLAREEGSAS